MSSLYQTGETYFSSVKNGEFNFSRDVIVAGITAKQTVLTLSGNNLLDAFMRASDLFPDEVDNITGLKTEVIWDAYRNMPSFNKTAPIQPSSEIPELNA